MCLRKYILLITHALVALLFLSVNMYAQVNWQWGRTATGASEGGPVTTDKWGNVFCAANGYGTVADFGGVFAYGGTVICVKYNAAGIAQWADAITGGTIGDIMSITTDTGGNLLIFGAFQGNITVGSFPLVNTLAAGSNYFLAKVSPSGTVLWARNDGQTTAADGSVATDDSGNIYIASEFTFPTISIGPYTLTNAGSGTQDIFMAKYSPSGDLIWATSAGGTGFESVTGITVSLGNIYIGGAVASPTVAFGPDTITGPGGVQRAYMAKYSPAGVPLWAKSISTASGITGIGSDAAGDIYVAGNFATATINFDTLTLTRAYTSPSLPAAVFVVKYAPTDTAIWGRTMSSSNTEVINKSLAVSPCGQVWLGCSNLAQVVLAPGDTLPLVTGPDRVFLAGYDADGHVLHYLPLASGGDDWLGVAADPVGNAYMASDFQVATFVVGPDSLHTTTPALEQFYVAKLGNSPDTMYQHQDTLACSTGSFTLTAPPGIYYLWSDNSTAATLTATTSGTYWVRVVACGDTVTNDTFHVTTAAALAPIVGPDSICLGGYATFTDATPGGGWYSTSTAIATVGAGSGIASGVSTGAAIISYTSDVGCSATKTVYINSCPESVTTAGSSGYPAITPNPAKDLLTLQIPPGAYDAYTIVNSLGQAMGARSAIITAQSQIDISVLPPGIYYIRLTGERDTRVARFVKE